MYIYQRQDRDHQVPLGSASSTTIAVNCFPNVCTTTIAEDPCNGTVKFDYLRVYHYFHYRRENDYFHYGS